jgi:two-component system KDP operon response regulator KdpE
MSIIAVVSGNIAGATICRNRSGLRQHQGIRSRGGRKELRPARADSSSSWGWGRPAWGRYAMENSRILLVQEDGKGERGIYRALCATGAHVTLAPNGVEAWTHLRLQAIDLVVIVLALPAFDGLAVLRAVRSQANTPVVVVGPEDEDILIRYLDAGADDYVGAGQSTAVLLARARSALVCAMLWQQRGEEVDDYHDDTLQVDLRHRRVKIEGEEVSLTPKEFDLLEYLVRHRDEPLTYDQILLNVWDKTCLDRPHYVHTYIGHLRRKLEQDPDAPRYLQTVYGVGYQFVGQDGAGSTRATATESNT